MKKVINWLVGGLLMLSISITLALALAYKTMDEQVINMCYSEFEMYLRYEIDDFVELIRLEDNKALVVCEECEITFELVCSLEEGYKWKRID